MAQGDMISDSDHVSRHVGGSKIDNGRITAAAFELKPGEKYLSVNWLEFFGDSDRASRVDMIRNAFVEKDYTLGAEAKFVVLNVGEAREYVETECPNNTAISFSHEPEDNDPSHSGILDTAVNDEIIVAELLAELIRQEDTFPARG